MYQKHSKAVTKEDRDVPSGFCSTDSDWVSHLDTSDVCVDTVLTQSQTRGSAGPASQHLPDYPNSTGHLHCFHVFEIGCGHFDRLMQ